MLWGTTCKDLVFIDFQMFPRLERMNLGSEVTRLGSIKILREYVVTILYQVSLQKAIDSARLQLCAVAIY